MSSHLSKMLYALTSAYNRTDYDNVERGQPPQTNIGKLLAIFSWGLDIVKEQADRVKEWDNIDNACGSVLDRYGANFGVKRNGTTDEFYRLAIRVKVMSQLSGGDNDTLINAAAELFDVDPSEVELEDVFPAKIRLYVNAVPIPENRIKLVDQITVELKRIAAAGVGMMLYLVYVIKHIIEVSSDIRLYPYTMPFCNTLYCGTFPYWATIGWTEKAGIVTSLDLKLLKYVSRFTGTYPSIKTLGWTTKSTIELAAQVITALHESDLCGEPICGTRPGDATVGWREAASVAASFGISVEEYVTRLCGTYPDMATVFEEIRSDVDALHSIEAILHSAPESGVNITGIHPDKTGTGWTVEAVLAPAGEVADNTYKSKFAGTEPGEATEGRTIEFPLAAMAEALGAKVDPTPVGKTLAGTEPGKTGLGFVYRSEISAEDGDVTIRKYTPKRSNMNRSGEVPDAAVVAGTSEAEVGVSGSADSFAVDAPYEVVPVGTVPDEVSTAVKAESSASVDCSAEGFAVNAPLCNTKYCGQK